MRSFHPRSFLSARAAKTAARFSQFAIAATRLALDDSKLTLNASLGQRTAICYGTSVSGAGDIADEAAMTLRGAQGLSGARSWSALEYPSHAASSYLAIEFGVTGPAISISSNCCTGIDAIHTSAETIAMVKSRLLWREAAKPRSSHSLLQPSVPWARCRHEPRTRIELAPLRPDARRYRSKRRRRHACSRGP